MRTRLIRVWRPWKLASAIIMNGSSCRPVFRTRLRATGFGMTDQGAQAKIAAYEIVRASCSKELEIARQMLTANVTFLATVIGFCFESRTASEKLRDDVTAPVVTRSFHRPIIDPFARLATRNKESKHVRSAKRC